MSESSQVIINNLLQNSKIIRILPVLESYESSLLIGTINYLLEHTKANIEIYDLIPNTFKLEIALRRTKYLDYKLKDFLLGDTLSFCKKYFKKNNRVKIFNFDRNKTTTKKNKNALLKKIYLNYEQSNYIHHPLQLKNLINKFYSYQY